MRILDHILNDEVGRGGGEFGVCVCVYVVGGGGGGAAEVD